jgi:ATP-binding cassette subfamily B multidrug efflux pump
MMMKLFINHSTQPLETIETIEFKNVSFTYPDTKIEALKNINCTIKKGDKIAIVGKTGSGKSTFAELLLRTYDTEHGEILPSISKNIKQINLKAYRDKIGYTPQDVFLFSDTVKNNILFGTDLVRENDSENEMQKFATIAYVHNDIIGLQKQYETVVGERGVMLSGGQKQRISIARSLAKNPELVDTRRLSFGC